MQSFISARFIPPFLAKLSSPSPLRVVFSRCLLVAVFPFLFPLRKIRTQSYGCADLFQMNKEDQGSGCRLQDQEDPDSERPQEETSDRLHLEDPHSTREEDPRDRLLAPPSTDRTSLLPLTEDPDPEDQCPSTGRLAG